jgi:inosine/xanthosine triphosphate pyrophosphatase family protein
VLFETRRVVEGKITPSPRGAGGFGYDPIFFYPPFGCTLAEATAEQKASVSHRGQAFRALAGFLVETRSSKLEARSSKLEPRAARLTDQN